MTNTAEIARIRAEANAIQAHADLLEVEGMEQETPVMRAYSEWRVYHDWAIGPEVRNVSEDEMEVITSNMTAHVDRLIATPSQCDRDLVLKFLAAVQDYQLFHGIDALEALEEEAHAQIGGEA